MMELLETNVVGTKKELISMLKRYSFKSASDEIFSLSSGKKSRYYVDCKATTMRAEALPLIGAVFFEYINDNVDSIGGLTMGADPISMAVAYYSKIIGKNLNSFSIRKETKKHGLKKWMEGPLEKGDRVIVVDDVVTTGGSTIKAIEKCIEAQLEIAGVIVLVDREEENGLNNIQNYLRQKRQEVPVNAVVRLTELLV